MEDCEIEVKLSDYKIINKYDNRFLYTNYMELFNDKTARKNNIKKMMKNIEKYNFGEEKHFNSFRDILSSIKYYENENSTIENNKISKCNFNYTEDDLVEYKQHINFLICSLKTINDDNFVELKTDINTFLSYDRITEKMFCQYKYLNNKLPKYKKMKQKKLT